MTAPVDVLAVMQAHTEVVADSVRLLEEPCVRFAVDTNSRGFSYAAGTVVPRLLSSFVDLHEARAAIAELIEAVRDQQSPDAFVCQCHRCQRVRAALARVGGAS